MNFDFSGRSVLVTGGSRGIAAEISRCFAKAGAKVAFTYSAQADLKAGRSSSAEDLADELRGYGNDVIAIDADLRDPSCGLSLVDDVLKVFRGVDTLILSASYQVNKRFLTQSIDEVNDQLRINIATNIQILQSIIPIMRDQAWGRIITIGSVQETAPSADMPVYAMTKAAVENLVRNLAVENASFGITVNNVSPGLIETDRNERFRQDMSVWEKLSRQANPLGRAGYPEDVAGAVCYLASEEASFVTGSSVQVTGGAHIAGNQWLSR